MTASGHPVDKTIPIEGGQIRVLRNGPTGSILEITIAGKSKRVERDPRETGIILYADLRGWDAPSQQPMTEPEKEAVLDALALSSPGHVVVEYLHETDRTIVIRRWEREPDGFLVDVTDGRIDYMKRDATMRISATSFSPPGGPRTRRVDPASARWVYPRNHVPSSGEIADVCDKLENITPMRFAFNDGPFKIEIQRSAD